MGTRLLMHDLAEEKLKNTTLMKILREIEEQMLVRTAERSNLNAVQCRSTQLNIVMR